MFGSEGTRNVAIAVKRTNGRNYKSEFKKMICSRIICKEISLRSACHDYGVSDNTLLRWMRKYKYNIPFFDSKLASRKYNRNNLIAEYFDVTSISTLMEVHNSVTMLKPSQLLPDFKGVVMEGLTKEIYWHMHVYDEAQATRMRRGMIPYHTEYDLNFDCVEKLCREVKFFIVTGNTL